MNSLILISPARGWGFQPILSGKGDRAQTAPVSYNLTSKQISILLLNSHEQTSKKNQTPDKLFDNRLKYLDDFSGFSKSYIQHCFLASNFRKPCRFNG
ncbi:MULTISPECIES: hypothetical protein [unclassified Microcoleus]|uniref:hypothetical protein n=1 Tax=unclassified Microcoleus TaxID=2642155 RepID=UPI0025E1A217|nr:MULTISPECIES: hypothetical protein [unclassified Microcoleus]